tara:strand:+ start:1136 stop:1987 length:852 start_codon:yes stop_codon:yes gene_type:complete
MGYGDDLLITSFASKIKKQYPDRQIIIGNREKNYASHSPIYENNPNIADCRKLNKTKPIHLIDYHEVNRPYIDYKRSTPNNYVWRKFRPTPGEIYFSDYEKKEANKIISEAKTFWAENHNRKFLSIIFIETSSTKINDTQFSIKHKNKDWGIQNWTKLINKLKNDFLIIQSSHNETKNINGIFIPQKTDFRIACALLDEVDFYVGPEGGFGHVAAALNKKAVLYFGGWISPEVIGYDFHENLYYEDKQSPCGVRLKLCEHCSKAREKISVDLFLKHIYKISSS